MKLSPVRIALGVLFGVLFLGLILPELLSAGSLFVSVFFGWFSFLQRVWPNVTVNWNGIGMVLLCSVLIIAGLHSLSGWLFTSVTTKANTCPGLRWRWSWTLALYAGVWMLFAAIMGAVGVAHQVGWLFRFGEPFYRPRKHVFILRHPLKAQSVNLFV